MDGRAPRGAPAREWRRLSACSAAGGGSGLNGAARASWAVYLMADRRLALGDVGVMDSATPVRPPRLHRSTSPNTHGGGWPPYSHLLQRPPLLCGIVHPTTHPRAQNHRVAMSAARLQVVPVTDEERAKANAEDKANRKAEKAMQARAARRARLSGSATSTHPGAPAVTAGAAVLSRVAAVSEGTTAAVAAAAAAASAAVRVPARPPPARAQSAWGAGVGVACVTDEISVAQSAPAALSATEPGSLADGGQSQSVYNLPARMRAAGDRGYGTPASPGYIRPATPPPANPVVTPFLPPSQGSVPTTGPFRPPPRRAGHSSTGLSAVAASGDLPPIGRQLSTSACAMPSSPLPLRRSAPSVSQLRDAETVSPSPAKKAKQFGATAVNAVANKKQTIPAATRKKGGPTSKAAPPTAFKKLKTLTLATLTRAVHDATRPAMALVSGYRVGPAGASSGSNDEVISSASSAALVQAVVDGLRPVLLEVVEAAKDVGHLRADLSRLANKVEVQGVGHEMTARAVVQLRDEPPPAVKAETVDRPKFVADPNEQPIDVELLSIADKNYRDMALVRTEFRKTLEVGTANTTTSRTVLHGPDRLMVIMSEVVERVHNYDAAAANKYLYDPTVFPVRNKPFKTQMVRVQKRILGHVSHMLTDFRKWALPPFWEVLEVDGENIEPDVATTWLKNDEFMLSEKGQRAVAAAGKGFFRRAGASNRVVKGAGPGGMEHVTMTVGHFMLFGSFARHELMVAAGLRPRHRAGSADGTYKWWCEEAGPVRAVVPPSATVFNGISIVDASDPRRYDMVILPSGSLSASDVNPSGGSDTVGSTRRAASGPSRRHGGRADAAAPAGRTGDVNGGSVLSASCANDDDEFSDANLLPFQVAAPGGARGALGGGMQGAVDETDGAASQHYRGVEGETDDEEEGDEDRGGCEYGADGDEERDDDVGLDGVNLVL